MALVLRCTKQATTSSDANLQQRSSTIAVISRLNYRFYQRRPGVAQQRLRTTSGCVRPAGLLYKIQNQNASHTLALSIMAG